MKGIFTCSFILSSLCVSKDRTLQGFPSHEMALDTYLQSVLVMSRRHSIHNCVSSLVARLIHSASNSCLYTYLQERIVYI